MGFAPGDDVHVAAIGTGVVREVRNGRRYLVELKGRLIVAPESHLTAVSGRKRTAERGESPATNLSRAHAPASLDLHGRTAAEAVAALDAFLSDALLAGHDQVQVIHGRSGGRLKATVHARLKQLPSVRRYRLDPRNPGMTIVTL